MKLHHLSDSHEPLSSHSMENNLGDASFNYLILLRSREVLTRSRGDSTRAVCLRGGGGGAYRGLSGAPFFVGTSLAAFFVVRFPLAAQALNLEKAAPAQKSLLRPDLSKLRSLQTSEPLELFEVETF